MIVRLVRSKCRLKGLAVAKRLNGFDLKKVIYTNRSETSKEDAAKLGYENVSFERLLNDSDILVCCASANKSNENIFDLSAFKQMKRSSVFVNVARGSMVNHADLYEALKSNIISSAGKSIALLFCLLGFC